jgi:hypothetical protein
MMVDVRGPMKTVQGYSLARKLFTDSSTTLTAVKLHEEVYPEAQCGMNVYVAMYRCMQLPTVLYVNVKGGSSLPPLRW